VSLIKSLFGLIGKTGDKAVAIFAASADEAISAIGHVRQGGVTLPIFVYCREDLSRAAAGECALVKVSRSPLGLFFRAQRDLWRCWVALGITAWTRKPGVTALKLAPFFFPPFRVLVLNENGDFGSANGGYIRKHLGRRFQLALRELGIRSWQLLRGWFAMAFAFFAQWNSWLSRMVFRQMRGQTSLAIASRREREDGVARYEFKGREWHWAAIERFLQSTDARWIVFEQTGSAHEAVDELLPLFGDPRTFAVSRQETYRAWQGFLFPTAPFQRLQRNEVTQVFAPVSGQIVVEREKMLRLGVPDLTGNGSSWYLLFWKAAAAGWRSYSVGGAQKPVEAPDVPFYEAQFVHKLLVEPELAALTPRDPLLARGNITQPINPGPGFRGLPRVLVLSPYLPYPLSHGGAVRMFSLCRALSNRIDFVLACFREKNDITNYDKLFEVFREVYVVAIDEKHAVLDTPAQVAGYESTSMRALIPEICYRHSIDLLQVEYTQLAAYRETVPLLPSILVEHDITFTLFRQLAEREPGTQAVKEYEKWLRFERDRLKAFEAIWTMSGYDRDQAITEGSIAEQTLVVPNGVDLDRFHCGPETEDRPEILYIGSFRHKPNCLGFDELRHSVMPVVWEQFPDAVLVVVAGPDHEKYWPGSRELDSRITVQGFVSDVVPLYKTCSVVAVPLPVSAGTNIKLMEALSCERAVVSTPVGCIGLNLRDGEDLLVREPGSEFAEGICSLLRDRTRRRRVAAAGRLAAEQRFSWNFIGETAMASYAALLEPKQQRRPSAELAPGLIASNSGA
jgi:polysaccharide biosynthesis protein PslH